jgi:hypothetical protein
MVIPRQRTAFLRRAALELSKSPNNPFWRSWRALSPPMITISLPKRVNNSCRICIVSGEIVLLAFLAVSYVRAQRCGKPDFEDEEGDVQ